MDRNIKIKYKNSKKQIKSAYKADKKTKKLRFKEEKENARESFIAEREETAYAPRPTKGAPSCTRSTITSLNVPPRDATPL